MTGQILWWYVRSSAVPEGYLPNSVQRDAYYHPTIDDSEEPFKWGLPDLDGLYE